MTLRYPTPAKHYRRTSTHRVPPSTQATTKIASDVVPAAAAQVAGTAHETRFIADVNAGGVVDAIPHKFWRVRLADGSIYANPQNIVYANIDQLVDETAAHGGQVSFTVSDPAI
ncbi:hypothetical protein B2J88_47440 [Rhodococcus sp. SRB_17]|nr:hypothetical protein [Rhodococcus sp. SRB_17]